MNGRELGREHGGPLRVVVPGYVGARSVKWIERVTVQHEESGSHFQREDYRLVPADQKPGPDAGFALGELALSSEILMPFAGARVGPGELVAEGYAISGGRAIERVDVSADGGRTWSQAELLEDLGPWAWRRWRATLEVARGPAQIVARAWDSAGATQPSDPAPLWNPGGYVNTSWPRVDVSAG
jgi:sulfite oxidase